MYGETNLRGIKMKKKVTLLVEIILLVALIIVSGCSKKKDPNTVTNFLKDLDSYSCDAKLEVINDKQVLDYSCRQYYNKKLGFRLDVNKERTLVYKGNEIYVKDAVNGAKYSNEKEFDTIYRLSFINEFLKYLYTNEEVKYSFKQIEGIDYQIIHIDLPGMNRNIRGAELYVNQKDYIPQRLLIYDANGRERVRVTYSSFNAEVELEQELFKTEQ